MKPPFLITLTVLSTVLFSCSKTSVRTSSTGTAKTVEDTTQVTINGTVYPVVTIGDLRWTQINYRGAGGLAVAPHDSLTQYGKLYSYATTTGISLPGKWRLPSKYDYADLYAYDVNQIGLDGTGLLYARFLAAKNSWMYLTGFGTSFNAYALGELDYGGGVNLWNQFGQQAVFWESGGDQHTMPAFYISAHAYPSLSEPDYVSNARSYITDTLVHAAIRFVEDVK